MTRRLFDRDFVGGQNVGMTKGGVAHPALIAKPPRSEGGLQQFL